MKLRELNLLLGLLISVFALAQNSSFENFTTTDGLVNNDVRAITQTPNGDLWFGTLGGLSMYNGTNFTNYTTDEGMPGNQVDYLTSDINGNIWFAAEWSNKGLVKFDGTTFTPYTMDSGLISNDIASIAADENGWVWVGHWGAGLSVFRGDTFVNFNEGNGELCDDYVTSVFMREGKVYANGYNGCISVLSNTGWSSINGPLQLGVGELSYSTMDVYGSIWGKTYDYNSDDVWVYDIETEVWTKKTAGLIGMSYIGQIYCDYLGVTWVVADNGIHSYDTITGWSNFSGKIAGNRHSSVLMDMDYKMWFGDKGAGLTKLTQKFDLTGEVNKRNNISGSALLKLYKVNKEGSIGEALDGGTGSGALQTEYDFKGVDIGRYILWGSLRVNYPETYYNMKGKWEDSDILYFGNYLTNYNIYFNTLDYLNYNASGTRVIEGTVTDKSTSKGIENLIVTLYDETGEVYLAFTKTLSEGKYSFPNLAINTTYIVRMETAGITNNSVHTVATNASHNTYVGRDFELSALGYNAVNNAVSVNPFEIENEVVYPNPTSGILNIKLQEPAIVSVANIRGAEVERYNLLRDGLHTLDIHTLNPGTYFVKLKTNNKIKVVKLLVY